ncbi:MAG: ABC transporter ATP-binding protein [Actinomycetota bacterium]|nr:ABC transporter ATP-binding protein [Actinomycetota bacterium]
MNALEVQSIRVSYGATPVLIDVSLEVPKESITVVLGTSGSGKTTLLRTIAGFERPQAGRIVLAGQVIDAQGTHVAAERRRLGYVPQEGALFPHLNVARNVAFGLPRRERRSARVDELLTLVGLADLRKRYPHELSGGQQQRVALARALAIDPPVILLDEPFSSLDAALRTKMRAEVVDVLRAAGTAAVMVTHDQQEAMSMADQVAVLRHGRVAQVGSPRELYTRPVDPAMAQFLGEANLVDADFDGDAAITGLGRLHITARVERRGVVLVRPEQISIEAGESGDGMRGQVVNQTYQGHDTLVSVAPDQPCGAATIAVRITGTASYKIGDRVTVRADGLASAWASREGAQEHSREGAQEHSRQAAQRH